MSAILLEWIRSQLGQEFADRNSVDPLFANGYLFGQLLQKHGLLKGFSFRDVQKDSAKLENFNCLVKALTELKIKCDARRMKTVMDARPGAAVNLLYDLYVKLERVSNRKPAPTDADRQRQDAKYVTSGHAKHCHDHEILLKRINEDAGPTKGDADGENLQILKSVESPTISRSKETEFLAELREKSRRSQEIQLQLLNKMKQEQDGERVGCTSKKEHESTMSHIRNFCLQHKLETDSVNSSALSVKSDVTGLADAVVQESQKRRPSMTQRWRMLVPDRRELPAIRKAVDCPEERAKRRRKVLAEQLQALSEQQELQRDEQMVERMLRKSQFERKVTATLMEVRRSKVALVRDQIALVKQQEERRRRESVDYLAQEAKDLENTRKDRLSEVRKTLELEQLQRLEEEKEKKIMVGEMCSDIADDIFDFVAKICEFREVGGPNLPEIVFKRWVALFVEGKRFFHGQEGDGHDEQNKLGLEASDAICDEVDVLEYLEMLGEWKPIIESLPDIPSNNILGYIVHYLQGQVSGGTPRPEMLAPERFLQACLLGKPYTGKSNLAQRLSDDFPILVLNVEQLMKDAVNAYKDRNLQGNAHDVSEDDVEVARPGGRSILSAITGITGILRDSEELSSTPASLDDEMVYEPETDANNENTNNPNTNNNAKKKKRKKSPSSKGRSGAKSPDKKSGRKKSPKKSLPQEKSSQEKSPGKKLSKKSGSDTQPKEETGISNKDADRKGKETKDKDKETIPDEIAVLGSKKPKKDRRKRTKFGKAIKETKVSTENVVPSIAVSDADDVDVIEPKAQFSFASLAPLQALGSQISRCLEEGSAVDDDTLVALILEVINCVPESHGWILDGYPKTPEQMRLLMSALSGIPQERQLQYQSRLVPNPRPINVKDMSVGLNTIILVDVQNDDIIKQRAVSALDASNLQPAEDSMVEQYDLKTDPVSHLEHVMQQLPQFTNRWLAMEQLAKHADVVRKFDGEQEIDAIYNDLYDNLESKIMELKTSFRAKRVIKDLVSDHAGPGKSPSASSRKASRRDRSKGRTRLSIRSGASERVRTRGRNKNRGRVSKMSLLSAMSDTGSVRGRSKRLGRKVGNVSARSVDSDVSSVRSDRSERPAKKTRRRKAKRVPIRRKSAPKKEITTAEETKAPAEPGSDDYEYLAFEFAQETKEVLLNAWTLIEDTYIGHVKSALRDIRRKDAFMSRLLQQARQSFDNYLASPSLQFEEIVEEAILSYNKKVSHIDSCDEEVQLMLFSFINDVSDKLWNYSDDCKQNAEEAMPIDRDAWITDATTLVLNSYLTLMQAELDKFQDTMLFMKDYYAILGQQRLDDDATTYYRTPLLNLSEEQGMFPFPLPDMASNDGLSSDNAFFRLPKSDISSASGTGGEGEGATFAGGRRATLTSLKRNVAFGKRAGSVMGTRRLSVLQQKKRPAAPVILDGNIIPYILRKPFSAHQFSVTGNYAEQSKKAAQEERTLTTAEEKPLYYAWINATQAVTDLLVREQTRLVQQGLMEADATKMARIRKRRRQKKMLVGTKSETDLDIPKAKLIANEKIRQEFSVGLQHAADTAKAHLDVIKAVGQERLQVLLHRIREADTDMLDLIVEKFKTEQENVDYVVTLMRTAAIDCLPLAEGIPLQKALDRSVDETQSSAEQSEQTDGVAYLAASPSQLRNVSEGFESIAPGKLMPANLFAKCLTAMARSTRYDSQSKHAYFSDDCLVNDKEKIETLVKALTDRGVIDWRRFLLLYMMPVHVPTQDELLKYLSQHIELADEDGLLTRESFLPLSVSLAKSVISEGLVDTCTRAEGDTTKWDKQIPNVAEVLFRTFADNTATPARLDPVDMLIELCADEIDPLAGFCRALSVATGEHLPVFTLKTLLETPAPTVHKTTSLIDLSERAVEDVLRTLPNMRGSRLSRRTSTGTGKGPLLHSQSALTSLKLPPKPPKMIPVYPPVAEVASQTTLMSQGIPKSSLTAKVPIGALLRVLSHGTLCTEYDQTANEMQTVKTSLAYMQLKDHLTSVYKELGDGEIKSIPFVDLIQHPVIRSLIWKTTFRPVYIRPVAKMVSPARSPGSPRASVNVVNTMQNTLKHPARVSKRPTTSNIPIFF